MEGNNNDHGSRLQGLCDEELVRMIDVHAFKYSGDELNAARAEAQSRGGLDGVRAKVRAARQPAAVTEQPRDRPITLKAVVGAIQATQQSGARVLREETILSEWATLIDHAAEHSEAYYKSVQERLIEAKIPGGCTWHMQNVRSRGIIVRVRRQFFTVELDQFSDYHMYIGARPYGIHLHCCRFLTVEPGPLKSYLSAKLTGFRDALSAPRNILVHQDLSAWNSVVDAICIDSAHELMVKLGLDTARLQRKSRGILESC
jgi:hypothetical protein